MNQKQVTAVFSGLTDLNLFPC